MERLAAGARGFVNNLVAHCLSATALKTLALGAGLCLLLPLAGNAQSLPDDSPSPPLRGTSPGASIAPVPVPKPDTNSINYGKPKKLKPLLPKQLGRPNAHPLPPLQPYASAPVNRRRTGAIAAPGPTFAVIPVIPPPKRPKIDEHPFDPVGLDIGVLRLKPYVEVDTGYDSNPNSQVSIGKGSFFARGEAGVKAQSDWSVHEFDATLKGGYSDYFTARDANRPDASLVANGRIDATRDLAFDVQGRFMLDSQRSGIPGILQNVTLAQRPLIYTYGASLGVTDTIGRLKLSLRGAIDRTTDDNATDSAGNIINLALQDFNAFGLRGRAAYEITPGISPFVEVSADKRIYDNNLDTTGFARGSVGIGGKIGTSFELTRILTGEISGGYTRRTYDDTRLKPLTGPTLDAALIWTASPLTTVTLAGTTAMNETTLANSSGTITRGVTLSVAHALFRNFTLTGVLSYQNADYQGTIQRENTFGASLKADYNLTRTVVIRSSFTHTRLQSTVPGADYTANTVLLGLRFQQ